MRQKSAFRLTLTRWLNGRVVVSKTIGCVFESRLPCQEERIIPFFLFGRGMDAYSTGKRKFLARLRVTRKQLDSIGQTYYFAIPSKPAASPYESRLCRNRRNKLNKLRGMDAYSTGKRKFLARLRVTRKRLDAIGQTYCFAIPSKPVASPYESRSAPKNGLFRSFCFAGEWTRLFVIAFCHCVWTNSLIFYSVESCTDQIKHFLFFL